MEYNYDIRTAINLMYSGGDYKERVYVLAIKDGTPIWTKPYLTKRLHNKLSTMKYNDTCNYYISANTFISKTAHRRTKEVYALRNIIVDIDFHGEDEYDVLINTFLSNIYGVFTNENVPMPNIEHITGRGVQLCWSFYSIPRKMEGLYNKVKDRILEIIKIHMMENPLSYNACTPDEAATRNLAGVFRLFGTVNANSVEKYVTSVKIINEKKYIFQDLVDALLIPKKEYVRKVNTIINNEKKSVSMIGLAQNRSNMIYAHVLNNKEFNLAKINNKRNKKAKKAIFVPELRDLHLFLYMNEVIKYDEDNALEKGLHLNKCFINPLPDRIVESIYRTICRAKNKTDKPGYLYTNIRIVNILDIDEEFASKFHINISGEYDKNAARNTKRRLKKELLIEKVNSLYKTNKFTIKKIAELVNLSINTVRKYIKYSINEILHISDCKKSNKKDDNYNYCKYIKEEEDLGFTEEAERIYDDDGVLAMHQKIGFNNSYKKNKPIIKKCGNYYINDLCTNIVNMVICDTDNIKPNKKKIIHKEIQEEKLEEKTNKDDNFSLLDYILYEVK